MKTTAKMILGFLIIVIISVFLVFIEYNTVMKGGTSKVQPIPPITLHNK